MAVELRVPRLGWSMEEGTFLGWLKQDGDAVKSGDMLYELEGEKATQEIESLDAGILRIPPNAPAPGAVVAVGALLGYLVAEGEAIPPEPASAGRQSLEQGIARQTSVVRTESERRAAPTLDVLTSHVPGGLRTPFAKTLASPRARRVAAELGVDWTGLAGSGRNGRVRERDVRLAATEVGSSLTPRRRVIADRMFASHQQTAAVTLTTRADATQLVRLRNTFKASRSPAVVPSYTDIIAKLIVTVLRQHPQMAARWAGDRLVVPGVDDDLPIGIAVDTDDGLLVPVIRQISTLTLRQLAEQSRTLIEQARTGKLSASEMRDGVFTITNLGAFGIDAFTPIINIPETAILGLGAIRREPVVLDNDQITVRDLVTLSLTFDHRITDGAPAARFLQKLREAIEHPAEWLLLQP